MLQRPADLECVGYKSRTPLQVRRPARVLPANRRDLPFCDPVFRMVLVSLRRLLLAAHVMHQSAPTPDSSGGPLNHNVLLGVPLALADAVRSREAAARSSAAPLG